MERILIGREKSQSEGLIKVFVIQLRNCRISKTVIYNESTSLLSKILVSKDSRQKTVAEKEITLPSEQSLFLDSDEQWQYEHGVLFKEGNSNKFALSSCEKAGSDCAACQALEDPECRFKDGTCSPVDFADSLWGCPLEPIIPRSFYLMKVQISNLTGPVTWLRENGEEIETSFGSDENYGLYIDEEHFEDNKVILKTQKMNYEVDVTEKAFFMQSPTQLQIFSSKGKNWSR